MNYFFSAWNENSTIIKEIIFSYWRFEDTHQNNFLFVPKNISFIIVEFSFHAEKKKFIVWRSENLFSCPRAGKQAVFQL